VVFGGWKTAISMVLLVTLCFLFLPVWPEEEKASVEVRPQLVRNTGALLGEGEEAGRPQPAAKPSSARGMTLTVPKLGLDRVPVPSGSRQAQLDREGVLRMEESGLPWIEGSNTFIAGHALGYPYTRVPRAFHDLDTLVPGDEVTIETTDGRRYTFEIYDRITVEPDDTWVTYPVEDRTVISLQTCVPIPTFENRLIVRGELVS
jgi:sortase A